MHRLLIERGEIIDESDRGEAHQESGSAFRPAREAEMMRRLVAAPSRHPAARHRREHLARHHRDLHPRSGAVFGACRSDAGRSRDARQRAFPFRLHRAVRRRIWARPASSPRWRRRKAISVWCRRPPWPAPAPGGRRWRTTPRRRSSHGCRSSSAPIIRPRSRSSSFRARRPRRWSTEVEIWSVRVAGWNAGTARALAPLAEAIAVPRRRVRRRGPAGLGAAGQNIAEIVAALVNAGASVRSSALVGSHATRYTVAAGGARPIPTAR